ncbi:MAG TPA: HAMP domain-containing methyl-accepting chemotaxis protein [Bacillales bacterium]|nr:HAMP domain-containing methyl-accepting chemotaxis protein [Bacillales bacterium]
MKKGLLKKSFLAKMLLTSSVNIILVGVILISSSYFIQGQVLETQLIDQANKIVKSTSNDMTDSKIISLKEDTNKDSETQKQFRSFLDNVSKNNPQIAQAYVFGTELKNGNQTSVIAMPTAVLDALKEAKIGLGDMYEQPKVIADAIKEMLKTKEIVYSSVYKDDYGTWMSVLKPYKDGQGNIVAYYAVDIDASSIVKGKQDLVMYFSISLLIILLILITIQYFIIRKSTAPLRELGVGIETLSKGNFGIKLKEGEDEIGIINKQFNVMVKNMQQIILNIQEVQSQNATYFDKLITNTYDNSQSYHEMEKEIHHISDLMENQKVATIESTKSMGEIVQGISNIANSSMDVRDKAEQMEFRSKKGYETVEEIMIQMQSLEEAVRESSNALQKLHDNSSEITGIVNLITEIANQTNLLALNAAIEAARAGEHGRGFAVVADEVRNLAEQSRASAGKIQELISTIQSDVDDAVTSISTGEAKALASLTNSEEITHIFKRILEDIKGVSGQIQEISASTQQVAAESEEISSVLEQLGDIAKQNSNSSNEISKMAVVQKDSTETIASDAQEMNKMFQKLQESIAIFKL